MSVCMYVYMCEHMCTLAFLSQRLISGIFPILYLKKINQGRVSWWTQNLPHSSGLFSQLSLGNPRVFLWLLFVLAGNLRHSSLPACLCDKNFCNFFLWKSGHFNFLLHQTRISLNNLEWTDLNILLLCLKYFFSFFLLFFFQLTLLINVDSSWATFSVLLKAYIPK